MPAYAFVLGSHPALSVTEVHAFFTRTHQHVTVDLALLPRALIVQSSSSLDPVRILRALGGTPVIVELLDVLTDVAPEPLARILRVASPPKRWGKHLALSLWDGDDRAQARATRVLGMALKRTLAIPGLRLILPRRGSALTTAQLIHARVPEAGMGLALFPTPGGTHVGLVRAVQDIRAYTERDRHRPAADPGRGMLPPKVAQMLVNISLIPEGGTLYDPFCGTGTVPMEALLLGLNVQASDHSPTQVRRTRVNLDWLYERRGRFLPSMHPPRSVFAHDIARHPPDLPRGSVDAVVTEGWLGPSRTRPPSPKEAEQTWEAVTIRLRSALTNLRPVLQRRGTVVLTLPAFRIGKRVLPFPFREFPPPPYAIDPLVPPGWEHPIFRGASRGTLLYGRPDAVVLREIVRLRQR